MLDSRIVAAPSDADDTRERLSSPPLEEQDSADRSLRILVVEDDVLIRMATADLLADMGHEVVEVGKVVDAREKLNTQQFDVMLTDLGLPDGSGVDLVRATLKEYPDVAVIVASGNDARAYFEDEVATAEVFNLDKPYSEASLRDVLNSVRESQSAKSFAAKAPLQGC